MVNTITQLFGIGSQWLFQSRKSNTHTAAQKYFELSEYKVAVDRISSIRINQGCVQLNYAQEPTLQISLKRDTTATNLDTRQDLVFAGDQADNALDALASCGYLDEIETRVKKRVFLNARFSYQDNLSNYQAINTCTNQSSRLH